MPFRSSYWRLSCVDPSSCKQATDSYHKRSLPCHCRSLGGLGSSLRAKESGAQALGRDWLGIELNPEYVMLAEARLGQSEAAPSMREAA